MIIVHEKRKNPLWYEKLQKSRDLKQDVKVLDILISPVHGCALSEQILINTIVANDIFYDSTVKPLHLVHQNITKKLNEVLAFCFSPKESMVTNLSPKQQMRRENLLTTTILFGCNNLTAAYAKHSLVTGNQFSSSTTQRYEYLKKILTMNAEKIVRRERPAQVSPYFFHIFLQFWTEYWYKITE